MKISNPLYVEKVKALNEEEQERLLSRMTGKLPRRLEKDKLSKEDALAIQLEIEDEQLQEWRAKMHALNAKSEKTKPEKVKSPAKEKLSEKEKPAEKAKKAKATVPVVAPVTAADTTVKPAVKKSPALKK